MRLIQLAAIVFAFGTSVAGAQNPVQITGPMCKPGVHEQPQGPFALYVFCDDALGTNIAVFLNDLGAPLSGPYDLGKRFWQGQEWANDVTSYAWLPDGRLLLATSAIYGTGTVYILDLEKQQSKVALQPQKDGCMPILKGVTGSRVEMEIESCEQRKGYAVGFTF
jgi:hypothetical protein